MQIAVEHSLTPAELTKTLAALAVAEQVDDALEKALGGRKQAREPVRERYLREMQAQYERAGRECDSHVVENLDRALTGMLGLTLTKATPSPWFRRRGRNALRLTEAQIQELITLIQAHYRVMIRIGGTVGPWGGTIPDSTLRKWRAWGLVEPSVNINGLISDAFIAGRLEQILEDGANLADMRRMAKEFPMPREASLTLQAVTERVGFDLRGGPGYRIGQLAEREIINQNAARVQEIVSAYRLGTLKHTPTNRTGLTAEEVAATETDTAVRGWRGVARELRNRMASEDRARDWERVATSSLRQTRNIGTVGAMMEAGVDKLYYDVHADACDHCKAMYLNADGTPIIFDVADIWDNIVETGGANYDRTASKMGDAARGWLPNALLHPWCGCRPKRVIGRNLTVSRKNPATAG